MIDIGGHNPIRAATKNLQIHNTCRPLDYPNFIKSFPRLVGQKKYAIKAMKHITKYDISITKWFEGIEDKEYSLRYGENPQQ